MYGQFHDYLGLHPLGTALEVFMLGLKAMLLFFWNGLGSA